MFLVCLLPNGISCSKVQIAHLFDIFIKWFVRFCGRMYYKINIAKLLFRGVVMAEYLLIILA